MIIELYREDGSITRHNIQFDPPTLTDFINSSLVVECFKARSKLKKYPPLILHPTLKYRMEKDELFRSTPWILSGLPDCHSTVGPWGDCEDLSADLAAEYLCSGVYSFVVLKETALPGTLHAVTAKPFLLKDGWDKWNVGTIILPQGKFSLVCPSRRFGMGERKTDGPDYCFAVVGGRVRRIQTVAKR